MQRLGSVVITNLMTWINFKRCLIVTNSLSTNSRTINYKAVEDAFNSTPRDEALSLELFLFLFSGGHVYMEIHFARCRFIWYFISGPVLNSKFQAYKMTKLATCV